MGRNGRVSPIGMYPTNERGFPVHPRELGLFSDDETSERRNNHHLSFYASKFGSTTISLVFRNLASQQVEMDYDKHVRLHQLYTGINLPPFVNMMDRINLEYLTQDREDPERFPLKVWSDEEHRYIRHGLGKTAWEGLKGEYTDLAVAKLYVDLGKIA
jgi:hypothetical protein